MKNINKLMVLIVFVFVGLVACSSTPKTMADDGITVKSGDGWINDSTYQMTVAGGWDRERYYIEDEDEDDDEKAKEKNKGKQPKSIFLLRQLSKTAAKTIAIRNFKQTMISTTISDTKVRDNVTIRDEIVNQLEGISIAPRAAKEIYSKRGDAEITFEFKAEGLRSNVENAVNDTVKRFKE